MMKLLEAPSKEVYPIVDAFDRQIDVCYCKKTLHKNKYLHRGVHIFVEQPAIKGQPSGFVLQLKSANTENGGTWSSAVSGHVNVGESYRAAAVREMKEEIGVEIDGKELVKVTKMSPSKTTGNEFVTLYSYLLSKKDTLFPNPTEVSALSISPLKEILLDIENDRSKFSPVFILLLNVFLTLPWNKNEEEN